MPPREASSALAGDVKEEPVYETPWDGDWDAWEAGWGDAEKGWYATKAEYEEEEPPEEPEEEMIEEVWDPYASTWTKEDEEAEKNQAEMEEASAAGETSGSYRDKYSQLWGNAELPELKERFEIQREVMGSHPWAGGTFGRDGKRESLPAHEVEALRTEQGISSHCKVPWKDRGPKLFGDLSWRGQALRSGMGPKPWNAIRSN